MEWFEKFYSKNYIDLVGFASAEQTAREIEFVVNAMNIGNEHNILDLCCGYGRHTYGIAKQTGCRAVGFDLSNDYLSIARQKYSVPNIKYIQGDMRNLEMLEEFDGVINLFTSFGFFKTDEENESVLEQVSAVLKKEGLFLLDYENKFYFVLNDVARKKRDWIQVDENRYYLLENQYDVMRERELFTAKLIENGIVKEETGYNIRLYSFPEIRRMLKNSGLEVMRIWGDFDGSEYKVDSRRLIILAKKVS